jgi:hypothetical protein
MTEDHESALFEPIVVLPAQISVDARWMGQTSGPIGLMLAVLEEAARCIDCGRRRRHLGVRKLAAEAEAWVRWDGREWPFAFANICDVLGLDVNAARLRLLGDESHATDRARAPVWSITRGRGRTSVCAARRASRAA